MSETPGDRPDIGLPTTRSFTGPWLSQQLLLTFLLGLTSFVSFSLLVKRKGWRSYLAPVGRQPVLAQGEDPQADDHRLNDGSKFRAGRVLNSMGLEWLATTIYTSDSATAYLAGPPTSSIDTLHLLKFFRFGTHLFMWLSLWSLLILMPVNYREHGWIDGVRPGDDERKGDEAGNALYRLASALQGQAEPEDPVPVPPGPTLPALKATTLYDSTHLFTTYFITGALLYLLTTHTSSFLAQRQRILHALHSNLVSRTILVRSLPRSLRTSEALQNYFGTTLQMSACNAWVLPDVGMGIRKLLRDREKALRNFEAAWVSWVGNPVRPEMSAEWQPASIEERIKERSKAILAGEESLPTRGWLVETADSGTGTIALGEREDEEAPLPSSASTSSGVDDRVPPIESDPAYGPPSFAHKRPTRRLKYFSRQKVDLLADLEARYLKMDVAVALVRKKMVEGDWKAIGVGFVEFREVKDALVSAQALFFEKEATCRSVMAPDCRDLIWRNVGVPTGERRLRQFFISVCITLLYLFYLPPLLFLGSLLSPAFLKKYIPDVWKILSASPRLEALVSTSLPSLVLVAFNAGLPMLLEATSVWQGVKTKSGVEMSVLKKYHIFLVTSVIFIFIITGTAFGVLLDLSANPMRILDKLSLSLPLARNFSLSYIILQALTVLPLQLLSLATLMISPIYVVAARTPRDHAEAHAAPIFKAGTVYPQALIVATLGLVYAIVKPLVTIFATLYFAIGYIVFKYKLLYVFYPPPSSTQQALTSVTRPRMIFAIFLFQIFQLSLFSVHGQVLMVVLTLPLMATTVWYGRFLDKRFEKLELFEALEGAVLADAAEARGGFRDGDAAEGAATPDSRKRKLNTEADAAVRGDVMTPPSGGGDEAHWGSSTDGDQDEQPWSFSNRAFDTGTSTPSEVSTPVLNSSAAGGPSSSGSALDRQKKIWSSPFARLGRKRSSQRTATLKKDSKRQRAVYHRPDSKYTNYREPSSDSGIDSLPGLLERASASGFSKAGRRWSGRAEDIGEEEEDVDDEGEDEVEADAEDEQLENDETYEHPAIRGTLKQLWLPSR